MQTFVTVTEGEVRNWCQANRMVLVSRKFWMAAANSIRRVADHATSDEPGLADAEAWKQVRQRAPTEIAALLEAWGQMTNGAEGDFETPRPGYGLERILLPAMSTRDRQSPDPAARGYRRSGFEHGCWLRPPSGVPEARSSLEGLRGLRLVFPMRFTTLTTIL